MSDHWEPILIEIWGTDSREEPEVLQMQDPEQAISLGRQRSHQWGVSQVVVMTESRLRLAQFTAWTLWKPEQAHRHSYEEVDCAVCCADNNYSVKLDRGPE